MDDVTQAAADVAQAAQNTVGPVVGAVESAVTEVVQTVESFADKAKKYFSTKEVNHLSDALIPLSAAVDDLILNTVKKSDLDNAVEYDYQAKKALDNKLITIQQQIIDLQTQISTLVQKVAQATS